MGVHIATELGNLAAEKKPSVLERGNACTVYITRLLNHAPSTQSRASFSSPPTLYTSQKLWRQQRRLRADASDLVRPDRGLHEDETKQYDPWAGHRLRGAGCSTSECSCSNWQKSEEHQGWPGRPPSPLYSGGLKKKNCGGIGQCIT